MDTTEKDIRSLFANTGELDRNEVALLLLQLVERIQNLENAQQRTWVGLSREDCYQVRENESDDFMYGVAWAEAKLKEKNTQEPINWSDYESDGRIIKTYPEKDKT